MPDTHGRYYVMSMIDLWTNAFASIGARTTGTGAGAYAIGLGTAHAERLPAGVMPIAAPTRYVRIAGQTCVTAASQAPRRSSAATASRRSAAGRLRDEATAIATSEDDKSSPAQRVDRLDAEAFFRIACRLLEDNPPRVEDRRLMERAHQIGLFTQLRRRMDGRRRGAATQRRAWHSRGRAAVRRRAASVMGDAFGQWNIAYRWGDFGTDYLSRAGAACALLRPEIPADALPALTRVDAEGRPLSGRHRYVAALRPRGAAAGPRIVGGERARPDRGTARCRSATGMG